MFPYKPKEKLCVSSENRLLHEIIKIVHTQYPDKYIVCPQVSILAIVEVKPMSKGWRKLQFNRLGKKYVDFVIVEKKSTKPVLVIEANGTTHNTAKRQHRDHFLKWVLDGCNIPFMIIDSRQTPETLSESLKEFL